ncbi:hypothetical protein CRG98_021689 [Punica granatum]|uniref:Uncharacterized protein n=1 Tax=Punica granatum TaxID=22663 RepID=A0A2I0JNT5_PUNGR|nr:hypothetical protein CRG98_021689 [Punica granatum]
MAGGLVELLGDCLTMIHTSNMSCLPHRHYSEQDGDSGLDPFRTRVARSMCIGVLDPVVDGLSILMTEKNAIAYNPRINLKMKEEATLDSRRVKDLSATLLRERPRATLTRLGSWMVSYPDS